MNNAETQDELKKIPSFGLVEYFSNNFADSSFEYGSDRWGICRYPLDSAGKRIVELLEYCPHTLGLNGGAADKSETVVIVTSYKGDTPNSIYFKINPEIVDVYSNHFSDLVCDNVNAFVNRLSQHMELINKVNTFDKFELFKCADFNVFFHFKYDHTVNRIFRVANIAFNPIAGHDKKVVCTFTNNTLTTMSSLRKMDMEFFNRYYKHKIQEAIPDQSFDDLHALIDLSNWNENLKSLVKMAYY
jgi:hypothetical protein